MRYISAPQRSHVILSAGDSAGGRLIADAIGVMMRLGVGCCSGTKEFYQGKDAASHQTSGAQGGQLVARDERAGILE
jgi:hypothetical protein